MSGVVCHVSGVTCQVSRVRCHVSGVTCQVILSSSSFLSLFLEKLLELVGGGSVINGAYPELHKVQNCLIAGFFPANIALKSA